MTQLLSNTDVPDWQIEAVKAWLDKNKDTIKSNNTHPAPADQPIGKVTKQ